MPIEGILLDQFGKPFVDDTRMALIEANANVRQLRRRITEMINARYDAAQTVTGNANHWAHADNLDPHTANALSVRRKLRIRSRYEIIENNPYLKGCILTACNDFVGTGPKLQITDPRISPEDARIIEALFDYWWRACDLTAKLWRLRMAKLVDGEGFFFAFDNPRRKLEFRTCPVTLDFWPVETDQVTGFDNPVPTKKIPYAQIDGLRWDRYNQPIAYNLFPFHPGGSTTFSPMDYQMQENWTDADFVVHWFRQDRGWLRGIPELTPSLPLCAMLRRYTLAVVQAAEIAADFSAVIETEGPPVTTHWPKADDPFDTFPIERGMITRMPWGYKLSQLDAKQPIQVYDMFVNALLREICRPLGMPFNIASGSSKEANMASAIVDSNIYRTTQHSERIHSENKALNMMFVLWFAEAVIIDGYLPSSVRAALENTSQTGDYFPQRRWRWDRIGLDHTDPSKVQQALEIASKNGFITDRDIQETYYNRDVEAWRKEVEEDIKFRKDVGLFEEPAPPVPPGGLPGAKKPPAE